MIKGPGVPDQIKQIIDSAVGSSPPGSLGAAFIAVVLSILQILGDEKSGKIKRALLEAPAIGMTAYAVGVYVIESGLGVGLALVCGAISGHVGVELMRHTARKLVAKRTCTDDQKD